MKQFTDSDILSSLSGNVCEACGGRKNRKQSHCSKDYFRLKPETRTALYQKFGDGYEQAFIASLNELGIEAELVEV